MLAREVMEKTYSLLKGNVPEVALDGAAIAEIGDDSDWHREVKGYTLYESYFIKGSWIIALGMKTGKYPADRFDRDIVAIKIDPKKTNKELLEQNKYFYYSVIISLASGEIGTRPDGFFGPQMDDLKISDFVIEESKFSNDLYGLNLQPLVIGKTNYDESIVEYLRDKILKVLS